LVVAKRKRCDVANALNVVPQRRSSLNLQATPKVLHAKGPIVFLKKKQFSPRPTVFCSSWIERAIQAEWQPTCQDLLDHSLGWKELMRKSHYRGLPTRPSKVWQGVAEVSHPLSGDGRMTLSTRNQCYSHSKWQEQRMLHEGTTLLGRNAKIWRHPCCGFEIKVTLWEWKLLWPCRLCRAQLIVWQGKENYWWSIATILRGKFQTSES
jgi:hypothetical protein